jgi:hypothetical protein
MRVPFVTVVTAGLLSSVQLPQPAAAQGASFQVPQQAAAQGGFVPPPPVPPAQHAPICAKPVEKQAINISVLISELQVVTITCHTEDRYNALIPRLRTVLISSEQALESFFSRAYGKRGQSMHDNYITELANSQSQLGLKSGDQFCRLNTGIFDELTPLSTGDQLADYAARKPIQQALAVDECPSAASKMTARSKSGQKQP